MFILSRSPRSLPKPSMLPTGVFHLGVPVEALFFVGNQLIATSHTGRIGVWNAVTKHWQVRLCHPLLGVGGVPFCAPPSPGKGCMCDQGPNIRVTFLEQTRQLEWWGTR